VSRRPKRASRIAGRFCIAEWVANHASRQEHSGKRYDRVALGASPADVLRLMLAHGLRTAIAGTAAGMLAALVSTRALTSLLYEVQVVDPVVYMAIGFVTILVALLASYVPSRRAVRIDPLRALRQE
jgi:ABC-type lipoprotein release transport system permease subunit